MTQETPPSSRSEFIRIAKKLGPAGPLALFVSTVPMIGLAVITRFMDPLAQWLKADSHGFLIYLFGYAILAGLALVPTQILAVLGGWAFGEIAGTIASLIAFTLAAFIAFIIARRASGDRVVKILEENRKWNAIYSALLGGGFWKTFSLIALVRLAPSPFAITNLVLGAAKVRLFQFLLATLIGMGPRIAIVVCLGAKLESYHRLEKPWYVWVIAIGATLAVLAIINHIGKKAVAKVTGSNGTVDPDTPPVESPGI